VHPGTKRFWSAKEFDENAKKQANRSHIKQKRNTFAYLLIHFRCAKKLQIVEVFVE
jgi:hypothetical protein